MYCSCPGFIHRQKLKLATRAHISSLWSYSIGCVSAIMAEYSPRYEATSAFSTWLLMFSILSYFTVKSGRWFSFNTYWSWKKSNLLIISQLSHLKSRNAPFQKINTFKICYSAYHHMCTQKQIVSTLHAKRVTPRSTGAACRRAYAC
jgi:hypothetical protein